MPAQVIGNQATAVELYVAFAGLAPSNAVYQNWLTTANSTSGIQLALQVGQSYAGVSDATLAASVLANMGISAATTNQAAFDALSSALVQVFAAYPGAQRGVVVYNMVTLLSGLENNATYGAAATAWNNTTLNAFTYASNTANTAPGPISSTPPAPTPSVFTLTTGIDNLVGGSGNDTFNASESTTGPTATLNSLDSIDGGAGTDTLNVIGTLAINTGNLAGLKVSNVEVANLTTASTLTADTTTWTGLTNLNAAAADNATVTGAATTDIVVTTSKLSAGAGDEVAVNGGKNVTVTAADTSTTAVASGDQISVGSTTAAAGTVNVTYTETVSDAADAGVAGSGITVSGGTAITVNSLAVAGAGSNAADVLTLGSVVVNGNASTTSVTVNQSAATATWAAAGDKISIVDGAVTIEDKNAATASDTITTVTLSNFGASEIKSTVLSTLNLTAGAKIAGGAVTLTQTAADTSTAATTLALNTSGKFGKISGTQADVYKTVNVTASAATTIADIEMDALTALNVGGAGVTTFTALTAAQNAKLATVTSTGAGLTIGSELATGVAVTGGAGVESIMIGATTKVIDLGAGNDVVTVSTTTMGAGGAVKGGDGIDTLVANTNGSAFSGLPAFTGFETLRVAGAAAQGSHNAVGFTALEIGATAGATTFTNVAAGVGLTSLAAATGLTTVTLADATGTADTFNLTLKSAGAQDLSANGISIAGVETINITNTDTDTTAHTNKLNLTADSVKSIVVTGNAGLDLTGSTFAKVTSFDASGITGATKDAAALAVTYVSGNSTVGEVVTIKGGSGNDSLTGSSTANDTIYGNDGADTLAYTGGADTFTGGVGKDVFDINATGTKTAYLTITDASAGDTINLVDVSSVAIADVTAGNLTKVTLGAAATFDQYLDAAAATVIADAGASLVKYFVYGGDTYLVVDNAIAADTPDDTATFDSGKDAVIKLTGVIDLTSASITGEVLTLA